MVTIRLHNSKTRTKEAFVPLDPTNVRMYVCGPTVYDRAHLGNGRPVVVFDTLYRLLRHVYGAGHVTYVRNFTDVDDKINATAAARKAAGDPRSMEALIHERTEETIGWYHADMDALGALRPNFEPRATEYIGPMVAMIEGLIAGDHAYAKDGHVLFRVRSYKDYGALSGRSVDDMIAGARVEVAPFKEDPMDFVLWKPSSEEEPGWTSPWGRGRPGWHIECSAMSYELLGPSFDIHGGGLDLQFPHHENEVAQSCCAHPEASFARYWMHNEMLQVEGKKMSKSLGNFFTVRQLLDGAGPQGLRKLSGMQIRTAFLLSHYRDPFDLTSARIVQVNALLSEIMSSLTRFGFAGLVEVKNRPEAIPADIIGAVSDDLNTPLALSVLNSLAKDLRNCEEQFWCREAISLYSAARFLGLDIKKSRSLLDFAKNAELQREPNSSPQHHEYRRVESYESKKIEAYRAQLSTMRAKALETRSYESVDRLKLAMSVYGLDVRFAKSGVHIMRMPGADLRFLPMPKTLMSGF